MSTHSITHGPTPTSIAAAAAVAVVAAAAFAVVTVSHDDAGSPASTYHPSQKDTSKHNGRFHPRTAGGKVQAGQP